MVTKSLHDMIVDVCFLKKFSYDVVVSSLTGVEAGASEGGAEGGSAVAVLGVAVERSPGAGAVGGAAGAGAVGGSAGAGA